MTDFKQIPLGLIPSRHDRRDYHISKIAPVKTAWPEEWTMPFLSPVHNQGASSMCMAFSNRLPIEFFNWRERGEYTAMSAGYNYAKREATDHQGEGMEPRQALAGLLRWGMCHDTDFPLATDYPDLKGRLTPELDVAAAPHRITAYAAVQTPDEIKSALVWNGPVIIGVAVYDSFYAGGHLLLPDTAKEALRGYHAVVIVGWTRDNRWLVQNSWGPDWGPLKGFCTIPFDYPIIEAWSATDTEIHPEKELVLRVGSKTFTDNGFEYEMDAAPEMVSVPGGGRTLVPLRFVAEHLGCKVDYKDGKITITKP